MSPEPYWTDGQITLHVGDCVEVLAAMEAASVNAIITDPPAGIGFMGREWDDFRRARNPADAGRGNVFGRTSAHGPEYGRGERGAFVAWMSAVMTEVVRVMKPGAHALVWSIPRTSHWTAWALEDAGLEIRDCIPHLFGSGFPKSLDVSKAIDRQRNDRAAVMAVADWLRERIAESALSRKVIAEQFGIDPRGVDLWAPNQADNSARQRVHTPTWEQWQQLRDMLGFGPEMDAEVWRLNGRKGTPGEAWSERETIAQGYRVRRESAVQIAGLSEGAYDLTAPATEDAARWEGWGTSLKPGQEMWWLARKPIRGTVAANVLQYGTGALNVDGCRVEGGPSSGGNASGATALGQGSGWNAHNNRPTEIDRSMAAGRWPPNIVLTHSEACGEYGDCAMDCPVGELDRQSGIRQSGDAPRVRNSDVFSDCYGEFAGQRECPPGRAANSGGASRFYPTFRYQAKAPSSERPRLKDGTAHSTVKPVSLMQWLVRLITPPGGVVLDCFAGTGTTAEACIVEGFRCLLIEKDPGYADLIRTRLRKDIQPGLFGSSEAS